MMSDPFSSSSVSSSSSSSASSRNVSNSEAEEAYNADTVESETTSSKISPSRRRGSCSLGNQSEQEQQKGTKRQKRFNYESDRSYEGLGLEYRRIRLRSRAKKDTFLPHNFDAQAAKTSSCRLLESLKNEDVDDLVGLVTASDAHGSTNAQDPQKRNPLLSLQSDSPLPPSYIEYIKRRALVNQNSTSRDTKKINLGFFDDSAAVAIGMYLEESLTASLLPLAGLHVLRCRAIEMMTSGELESNTMSTQSSNTVNNNDDRDHPNPNENMLHPVTGEKIHLDMNRTRWKGIEAFEEWTLPPEEAILKLYDAGMLSKEASCHFVPDASRYWSSSYKDGTDLHQKERRD